MKNVLGSEENWPILVSLTAVPAVIQAILLLFLPESPRFLILDKKDDEAGKKALIKLRATDDIDEEMDEIKAEGNSSANDSGSSLSVWQLLQSPNLRLALFVTICMHLSQQLSGITAIFYYSTKFFQVSFFQNIREKIPGNGKGVCKQNFSVFADYISIVSSGNQMSDLYRFRVMSGLFCRQSRLGQPFAKPSLQVNRLRWVPTLPIRLECKVMN